MQTLRRYLRLLRVQFRMSATTAMQYRTEFLLKGALALFWIAVTLVPLMVVFSATRRPSMFGWTYERSLVVLAWFTLLKAVLEGLKAQRGAGVSTSRKAANNDDENENVEEDDGKGDGQEDGGDDLVSG